MEATVVAGSHEKDVAWSHPHALRALRGLEVLPKHVLTRLQPASPRTRGHVKQDGPTDQPILEDVDGAKLCTPWGHRLGRSPIEEVAVERHVTQGVNMAVPLVVVVDADIVLGEGHRSRPDVHIGQHRHVVVCGLGNIDPSLGDERPAEGNADSVVDQPCGGGRAPGSQVAKRS